MCRTVFLENQHLTIISAKMVKLKNWYQNTWFELVGSGMIIVTSTRFPEIGPERNNTTFPLIFVCNLFAGRNQRPQRDRPDAAGIENGPLDVLGGTQRSGDALLDDDEPVEKRPPERRRQSGRSAALSKGRRHPAGTFFVVFPNQTFCSTGKALAK